MSVKVLLIPSANLSDFKDSVTLSSVSLSSSASDFQTPVNLIPLSFSIKFFVLVVADEVLSL